MMAFDFDLSSGNSKQQNKTGVFNFSLSEPKKEAKQKEAQVPAVIKKQTKETKRSLFPKAVSDAADLVIKRPSQAFLAAAIENAENPDESFLTQLAHGGQEFMQGLKGNRPDATGEAYLEAKGWGGDGLGKQLAGGALDALTSPALPGVLKLGNLATKSLPIASKLGKSLAATSAAGGTYGVLEGIADEGSLGDIAKSAAVNAALWPAVDLGMIGAGKAVAKSLEGLSTPGAAQLNFTSPSLKLSGADKTIVKKGQNKGLGTLQAAPDQPIAESQFKANTLTNSEFLQEPEVQKLIQDTQMMYEVKPNAQSVERATKMVLDDFQGAMNRIKEAESLNSAEDAAAAGLITNALRKNAQETGDYSQLTDWLKIVQPRVTATAQSLQALGTWKNMTVEGALTKAAQVVGQVNRELKGFKGKVELTPDDIRYLTEQMTRIEQMPEATAAEQRAKDIEFARVKTYIANKIPADAAQKIDSIRRIAMLLNPKTLISRNMGGNLILGAFENLKDVPGSLVDMAASGIAGTPRTTLFPSAEGLATQGKGLFKGIKETAEDIRLGVDTSPSRGQYELPNNRTFDNGMLNALDKATQYGLQMGDRPFYQAAYDEALRQQIKISGAIEPAQEMKDIATKVAQDRTFQNDSEIARGVESLRGGINKIGSGFGIGSKQWGLGNIIVPFAKTPGNIMDKAVDYSPVGFIRAAREAYQGGRTGEFDQKRFVDAAGRAVTGTGLIMLGYDLAKSGVITGQANKDYDVASLQKSMGQNPYSYNISAAERLVNGQDPKPLRGDVIRTYDFAQPVSVALAIGADIFSGVKDRKQAENIAIEGIKSGGTTLLNQSVLQGLQKVMGGYDVMQNIISSILQTPLQFTPSLGNMAAKIQDPYARETYSPDMGTEIGNKIKAKLPGASESLPLKSDTLGRNIDSVAGGNSMWNTMFNPGMTKVYDPTPAEEMIMDIYNQTGEKIQFPRLVDKNIKGQPLTTEQYTQYQQLVGQRTMEVFSILAADEEFRSRDPQEQAKVLQTALTELNQLTKYELGIEVPKPRLTKKQKIFNEAMKD